MSAMKYQTKSKNIGRRDAMLDDDASDETIDHDIPHRDFLIREDAIWIHSFLDGAGPLSFQETVDVFMRTCGAQKYQMSVQVQRDVRILILRFKIAVILSRRSRLINAREKNRKLILSPYFPLDVREQRHSDSLAAEVFARLDEGKWMMLHVDDIPVFVRRVEDEVAKTITRYDHLEPF
jgi:hypothetical protein